MGIFDRFRKRTPPPPAQHAEREPTPPRRAAVVQSSRPTETERQQRQAEARKVEIQRDEYIDTETEKTSLVLGGDGLPTGKLVHDRNRFVIVTNAGMVNPRSTQIYRLGIHSFTLRGTSYTGSAVRDGDFRPGVQVRLQREPHHPHDSNAVAVCAPRSGSRAGYANKTQAKRIARRMDAGEDMVAITTRGEGPGAGEYVPHILVADRETMTHLLRETGIVLT